MNIKQALGIELYKKNVTIFNFYRTTEKKNSKGVSNARVQGYKLEIWINASRLNAAWSRGLKVRAVDLKFGVPGFKFLFPATNFKARVALETNI